MFLSVSTVKTGEYHGPAWWQYLLMFTLLPAGVVAPFGTTILGWIATAQIRHSAGKLYGLGLAVFDGLLFPLLTLTGLVAWFWWWVFRDLLYPHQIGGLHLGGPPVQVSRLEDFVFNHATALIVLSTLLTAGILCLLIIRNVWRAVNQAGETIVSGAAAKPESTARKPFRWTLLALVLIPLLALALILALWNSRAKQAAVIDVLPPLQPEAPGVMAWRYKCSVPPDHSLLFTVISYESNGVASVDQELSSYLTMGKLKDNEFTYELTRQDGAMLSPELRDSYRWNRSFRARNGGGEMPPVWRAKDKPEGGWSVPGKSHYVLHDGETNKVVIHYPFTATPERFTSLEIQISLHKLPEGVSIGSNCSMSRGTDWLEAAQGFSNRRKAKANSQGDSSGVANRRLALGGPVLETFAFISNQWC